MAERHWERVGQHYTLGWGGRSWTLIIDDTSAGLRCEAEGDSARLLSLYGLAAEGRSEQRVFTTTTLAGLEEYRSRIQATFAPEGWHGLFVRAAWSPSCEDAGVDLEVQASATSVGLLRDLEVMAESRWRWGDGSDRAHRTRHLVLPRDSRSAALSDDGREPAAESQPRITLAPTDSMRFSLLGAPEFDGGQSYLEMVPPNDVARLIQIKSAKPEEGPGETLALRYGLFGHDIEKGVVFRARLRGYWARSDITIEDANLRYRQFLIEPPPLGP